MSATDSSLPTTNSLSTPGTSALQEDIATASPQLPSTSTPGNKPLKPFSQQDLTTFSSELRAILASAENGLQEWTSLGGSRDTEAIKAIVNAARILADADAKVWKDIYLHKANGIEKDLNQKVEKLEELITREGGRRERQWEPRLQQTQEGIIHFEVHISQRDGQRLHFLRLNGGLNMKESM